MKRLPEVPPDPFGEYRQAAFSEDFQILGGRFRFETDCPELLQIVRSAYSGLPAHTLGARAARFVVKLLRTPKSRRKRRARVEPEPIRPLAGGGLLCGAMESANFAAIDPWRRTALIVVSGRMLASPYHVRYELLEFAVYVLAARAQKLVPLHAACVGANGQGILLLGPSGAGKSTVTLHCLLQGMDFLAEDSVLVRPSGLRATGIANFLHVRTDMLKFLSKSDTRMLLCGSSAIRRRSGVEKLEIDLRRPQFHLARTPLRIRSVAFISPRTAGRGGMLVPVHEALMMKRLLASQQYAANQPGWRPFVTKLAALPAYELRRGRHPLEAATALREHISGLTA